MRILILGSGGLVGGYLRKALEGHDLFCVSRSSPDADIRLDAADYAALEGAVSEAKPEVVVNCVKNGFSSDQAETSREETWRSNVMVADNAARMQKGHGFSLVHMSTDWVYEGREGVTYTEDAIPYPQNFYSYTKAVAEERVMARCGDYLILRPTGIFGLDRRGGNFFMRARKALSAGEELAAPSDQYSQPIYAGELAAIMADAIVKKARGVYNAVGKDYCSRYDLALMFCDAFGWDRSLVKGVPSAKRAMRIPGFLRVDTARIERDVRPVRPLREQIASLKEECG
jgi:dTDP-4-dehydrorhamnose reductase